MVIMQRETFLFQPIRTSQKNVPRYVAGGHEICPTCLLQLEIQKLSPKGTMFFAQKELLEEKNNSASVCLMGICRKIFSFVQQRERRWNVYLSSQRSKINLQRPQGGVVVTYIHIPGLLFTPSGGSVVGRVVGSVVGGRVVSVEPRKQKRQPSRVYLREMGTRLQSAHGKQNRNRFA